LRTSLAISPEM